MTAVEFVISLKETASAGINKIAAEFSTAKKNADMLGGSISSLKSKGETLRIARDASTSEIELKRLNKELQRTETEITKMQNMGKGGQLKDALSQIPGAGLLTNPLVAGGLAAVGIGKLGIEAEKTKVAFDVLLGSEEKSAKMLKEMNQFAASTPLEFGDLQNNAKMMLGFGIAQEKVMPNLKMLGDVSMGDAQKLQQLTLAFSQISSAGKMQGQDLLQLINAGFNPLQEISKMTGKSMGELRGEMEKGQISSEMVTAAFQHATSKGGLFYGMLDKMGQTLGGRISTLIDDTKNSLKSLYEIVAPLIVPAFIALGAIVGGISFSLNWMVEGLKKGDAAATGVAIAIGFVSIALAVNYAWMNRTVIMAALKNTWDTIVLAKTNMLTAAFWKNNLALAASPIGWIVGLVALLGYGIYQLIKHVDGWGKQWDRVVGMVKSSWSIFVDGFMIGIDKIQIGWYKFKNAFGLGDKTENNKMISQLDADVENRKKEIAKSQQAFKDNAKWELEWKKQQAKKETAAGTNTAEVQRKKREQDLQKELDAYITKYHALDGKKGGIFTSDRRDIVKEMEKLKKGSSSVLNDKNRNGINDDKERNGSAASTVASGGQRNTQITINVGKQIENLIFNGGVKENVEDIKRTVTELLDEVLLSAMSVG